MRLVPCKLCGEPTEGSVGAAGIRWPMLCQPCKDAEDAALRVALTVLCHTLTSDQLRIATLSESEIALDGAVRAMLPGVVGAKP